MSPDVELTVVVPMVNRVERVKRAVATVIAQSERIFVVIVDDGSSPEQAVAVDELAAGSSQVRVLHQANRGPSAARNAGLGLASSRCVLFLDSDDELAASAFPVIARSLLRFEDAGLLCGAVQVVSPDGASRTACPAVMPGVPWAKLSSLAGSFAVRTDVALAVGGYDEALHYGENTDFILRLAEECRRRSLRIVATDDVLSVYHVGADERRYDARRLDAAVHLLRRGRFDLHVPGERARLHAIAAVNAARVSRYRLSVKHGALAAFAEPGHPRHLVRFAIALSGPLARRLWLRRRLRSI